MFAYRAVALVTLLSLDLVNSGNEYNILPYYLLRLVEFKGTDEIIERGMTISAEKDDGLAGHRNCLNAINFPSGGAFLCSIKTIFESQFLPKHTLVGEDHFASIHKNLFNYENHPCSHAREEHNSKKPKHSAEVVIALQGNFVLYGCHNYITLTLQRNKQLSNFAILKAYKVPHNLIQFKQCAKNETDTCSLSTVEYHDTIIAEDYVCCCSGPGCAAVIIDQGGWNSPFPLLRYNIQLEPSLAAKIGEMIYSKDNSKYKIKENTTATRRRIFTNYEFSMWDVILICFVFFSIT
ncbi:hypothetical protein PFISCL1PPCAC_8465, partial [Pristionchus fissidentatus]